MTVLLIKLQGLKERSRGCLQNSWCPGHSFHPNTIFPIIQASGNSLFTKTDITLLPGMLLACEIRDCICLLQGDPPSDTHPSSICQSFFLQGVLVSEPTKAKASLWDNQASMKLNFAGEERPVKGFSVLQKKTSLSSRPMSRLDIPSLTSKIPR